MLYVCTRCGLIQSEPNTYTERVDCGEFWGAPCTQEFEIVECCDCFNAVQEYSGKGEDGDYEKEDED